MHSYDYNLGPCLQSPFTRVALTAGMWLPAFPCHHASSILLSNTIESARMPSLQDSSDMSIQPHYSNICLGIALQRGAQKPSAAMHVVTVQCIDEHQAPSQQCMSLHIPNSWHAERHSDMTQSAASTPGARHLAGWHSQDKQAQ